MECPPGLHVRPIDGYRTAGKDVLWNSSTSELSGEPLSVDSRLFVFENVTELDEEALHPRVGLFRLPIVDSKAVSLAPSKGIQNSGHLDEVSLVVSVEGVYLAGDEEAKQSEMTGSADLGIDEGPEGLDNSGTLNQLTCDVQLRAADWSAPARVEGWAH